MGTKKADTLSLLAVSMGTPYNWEIGMHQWPCSFPKRQQGQWGPRENWHRDSQPYLSGRDHSQFYFRGGSVLAELTDVLRHAEE